jgi:hypothetical protein
MTTPTLHRLGVTLCLSVALIRNVSATGQSSPLPPSASPENRPSETSKTGFCPASFARDQRPVSWQLLIPNILCDQKRIRIFPWHLVQGNSVLPAAAVAGATTGLVLLDPSTTPYFRRTSSFHSFNQVLSGANSTLAIALVPLSFYGLKFLRHNSYGEQTALLAGEAIADAEIVTTVMKDVDRRLRPVDIPPSGNFANTYLWARHSVTRSPGTRSCTELEF